MYIFRSVNVLNVFFFIFIKIKAELCDDDKTRQNFWGTEDQRFSKSYNFRNPSVC